MRREDRSRTLLGSPEAIQLEEDVVNFARAGRGTCSPIAERARTDRLRLPEGEGAVDLALCSLDRVSFLTVPRGKAGTQALHLLSSEIEAAGQSVGRFRARPARNGDGTAHLSTLFTGSEAELGRLRGGAAIVEESHDLGIKELSQLFGAAKDANARIFLTAEQGRKLSPAMELLRSHAGVRSETAREARRAREEERVAARALHEGRGAEGARRLDRIGALIEAAPEKLPSVVASAYAKAQSRKLKPLVVAKDKDGEISRAVRAELRSKKLLGRDRGFEQLRRVGLDGVERTEAESYRKGQVVVFYKSAKGFRAGHRYEVMGRDPFGNVLAREGRRIEALPLGKSDRFDVFTRARIELARGDVIRVTATGRTKNESFGPEKLLSKRQQAVRHANFEMFGIKTPDRRYRVPRGSSHRIAGFTLTGNIKLDNGWVLPKNFGYLEHGYCASSPPKNGGSHKSLLIVQPSGSHEESLVGRCRGIQSVQVFGSQKDAVSSAVASWSHGAPNQPGPAGIPRTPGVQPPATLPHQPVIERKEPGRDG